jgi:hypothetical protein
MPGRAGRGGMNGDWPDRLILALLLGAAVLAISSFFH